MTVGGGQIFVRSLDGKSLCLQVPSKSLSGRHLKALLEEVSGIPPSYQRLVTGVSAVNDESTLTCDDDGYFPTCSLLLRLVGGKGGFGSLLRGAATKAGQRKTSNFAACRDMSGRRLRHVNAEAQLKDWRAEARERELERKGEQYIRKVAKENQEKEAMGAELSKLRALSEAAMDSVSSAVKLGLQQTSKKLGKRKLEGEDLSDKKARLLKILEAEEEEDDEEDSEEEDDEEMEEEDDGSMRLSRGSSDGAGPSSSSASDEEARPREDTSGKSAAGSALLEKVVVEESIIVAEEKQHPGQGLAMSALAGDVFPLEATGKASSSSGSDSGSVEEGLGRRSEGEAVQEAIAVPSAKDLIGAEAPGPSVAQLPVEAGSLVLADVASVSQLEALGLERLKSELQVRGLKCGGSLRERAARLFLLTHTPLEKLDPKIFAKPAAVGKGAKKG
eukprot:TRINITY_DN8471_c0_g1_i1.p1 TRINITY_DN8471_c0_g1~~TRINITY_DN8471_c0_g1_i1.p1  ORF type:complete len:446 (-),score=117.67 TRINITY_DN8471_c0_g1_i1:906-2243(-)